MSTGAGGGTATTAGPRAAAAMGTGMSRDQRVLYLEAVASLGVQSGGLSAASADFVARRSRVGQPTIARLAREQALEAHQARQARDQRMASQVGQAGQSDPGLSADGRNTIRSVAAGALNQRAMQQAQAELAAAAVLERLPQSTLPQPAQSLTRNVVAVGGAWQGPAPVISAEGPTIAVPQLDGEKVRTGLQVSSPVMPDNIVGATISRGGVGASAPASAAAAPAAAGAGGQRAAASSDITTANLLVGAAALVGAITPGAAVVTVAAHLAGNAILSASDRKAVQRAAQRGGAGMSL